MQMILYYIHVYRTHTDTFTCNADYEIFVNLVGDNLRMPHSCLYAYCLLPSGYHILTALPQENFPGIIHTLHRAYGTQREGSSCPDSSYNVTCAFVEKNEYATMVSCYIHSLPHLLGLCDDPENYPWSSMQYYMCNRTAHVPVDHHTIKAQISRRYVRSVHDYRKYYEWFVTNRMINFADILTPPPGSAIGSNRFRLSVDAMRNRCTPPSWITNNKPVTIEDINTLADRLIADDSPADQRMIKMYLAYIHTPSINREIGAYFANVSAARVSQIIKRAKNRIAADPSFNELIGNLNKIIYESTGNGFTN